MLTIVAVKNVYARFSYGSRRDGEVYDPYVQLMPVTDIEDAHHDWEVWYAKWAGSSSQPSSVSSVVQSTPIPSSLSTLPPHPSSSPPPSSSPSSSPSISPSLSLPTSLTSSGSNPLATGDSTKISGAVEDDSTEEKSDPVRSFLFPSLISAPPDISVRSIVICLPSSLVPSWLALPSLVALSSPWSRAETVVTARVLTVVWEGQTMEPAR